MTAQTTPSAPASHPIDRLYRFAAGDRVLAVVLSLAALALLLALLLPQAPPAGAQQNPERWLAETASRYGSLGSLMQSAGLFDMQHSPWLLALLALLAFVLLLRLGLATGDAWQRLRRADPVAAAQAAARWPLHAEMTLPGAVEPLAAELVHDLHSEGWRIVSVAEGDAVVASAERSVWGVLATPLLYLGLLTALAGLWLGQQTGWRQAGVVLAPGQSVRLSQDDTLVIGALPALATVAAERISIQRDGQPAQERSFAWLGAARAAGVTVRRTGEGQALSASASDASGNAVLLQPVDRSGPPQRSLTLVFSQPRAEQLFLAPDNDLVVSVVAFPTLPERGFSGPTFLVQAFPAGQQSPIANQFIQDGADLVIDNVVYTLTTGRFVTVEVSRNPGLPLVLAGVALALAAAWLAIWRPAGQLALTVGRQRAGARVAIRLNAARFWRHAPQWLAAWSTTYRREDSTPPRTDTP